jgi:hypothetical protein
MADVLTQPPGRGLQQLVGWAIIALVVVLTALMAWVMMSGG